MIDVAFLNDAYGGTSANDRNLYIDSVTYYGRTTPANIAIVATSTRSVTATVPATDYTIGTTDTLTLRVSEDAWRGDAMFRVSIDGTPVGDIQTVTALRSQNLSQDFTFTGSFGPGTAQDRRHVPERRLRGTATTDRNLYVDQITFNGETKVLKSFNWAAGRRSMRASAPPTSSSSPSPTPR